MRQAVVAGCCCCLPAPAPLEKWSCSPLGRSGGSTTAPRLSSVGRNVVGTTCLVFVVVAVAVAEYYMVLH